MLFVFADHFRRQIHLELVCFHCMCLFFVCWLAPFFSSFSLICTLFSVLLLLCCPLCPNVSSLSLPFSATCVISILRLCVCVLFAIVVFVVFSLFCAQATALKTLLKTISFLCAQLLYRSATFLFYSLFASVFFHLLSFRILLYNNRAEQRDRETKVESQRYWGVREENRWNCDTPNENLIYTFFTFSIHTFAVSYLID